MRFAAADRMAVQEAAARAIQADPAPFFARFVALPQSLGGRFISADAFKETFDVYRDNPAHRQRYTAPLHLASVALANAWLRHVLQQPRAPGRDTVVFITGVPGAGKTTAVLTAAAARSASGGLPLGAHAIHEGSFARPKAALNLIRDVLAAGLRPVIAVQHTRPERALENTLQRFALTGRGASIHTMARLQGNLPESLAALHQALGNAVTLRIIDRRNFENPRALTGWSHLPVLTSEGDREHLRQRLEKHLDRLRGQLPPAAWRQACGLPPE